MYDAIIVGARVAGAPAAMLLARAGYRVLLVDRATFPSDTMSTHYIHPIGVARLKAWDLLDRVLATGAPPIAKLTTDRFGHRLSGMAPHPDVAFALCPRRSALDTILATAAVEAGAEVREDFVVEDLLWEGERVAGIRGHARGGASVEERAPIVIGADGVHSIVARAVAAPEYHVQPPLSCGYYGYYSGVSMDGAEVYFQHDRALFGFPTNDGLTCIAIELPAARFSEVRTDHEAAFNHTLQGAPEFAGRIARGRLESRLTGMSPTPNYFRKPYGPGWALVGDAGYHKDPVTGTGITDAFLDAELLVEALIDGFSTTSGAGAAPALEPALAGYEQRRNERALPLYQFTIQAISFQPPAPEQVLLLQALQGNQEDTDRFFAVTADARALAEFMAPDNLRRIVIEGQRRVPAV